jgi:hypothetical protein
VLRRRPPGGVGIDPEPAIEHKVTHTRTHEGIDCLSGNGS